MLNMNRFKIFLACALIGITFCTTVLAQSHRHSQRNDSTENVILEENEKSATSDAYNAGYSDGEEIRKYVDEMVKDALSSSKETTGDRDGFLKDAVDEDIIVAAIAVAGIFFGPVILVAIILFFIYKRKKQRDQVVIAAINKGVDIPAGYGGNYSRNTSSANEPTNVSRSNKTAVAEDPMMHKGITNICTGLGLVVFAYYLGLDILVGIGWMVVIFGIGKVVIAYLSGDKVFKKEEPKYTRTIEKVKEDEKSE